MEGEPSKVPLEEETKIAQIKQAFAEDAKQQRDAWFRCEYCGKDNSRRNYGLILSGQEWYERFINDLLTDDEHSHFEGEDIQWEHLILSAKRAANIEDKPSDDPGQQFTMEL